MSGRFQGRIRKLRQGVARLSREARDEPLRSHLDEAVSALAAAEDRAAFLLSEETRPKGQERLFEGKG